MKNITIEEYIETIYALEKKEGKARTGMIAALLNVKPPSVTEMLQKLQEEGLVKYETYTGVNLTLSGKAIGDKLRKKHKLIGNFLEIIGVDKELAEADACQIEHHVSLKTMERLEKFVKFVHGSPSCPKWIEHFNEYCETGDRSNCKFCNNKNAKPNICNHENMK